MSTPAELPSLSLTFLGEISDIVGGVDQFEHDPAAINHTMGKVVMLAGQYAATSEHQPIIQRLTANLRFDTITAIAEGKSPYKSLREEYGMTPNCIDDLLVVDAAHWLRRQHEAALSTLTESGSEAVIPLQQVRDKPLFARETLAVIPFQDEVEKLTSQQIGQRDQALLERIRGTDSDASAFGELYQHHYHAVYSFTLKRMNSYDIAAVEDCVSETFRRALQSCQHSDNISFNIDNGAQRWLMRIARNLILDRVKVSHYKQSVPSDMSCIDRLETLLDNPMSNSVETEVLTSYRDEELWNCVAKLGPTHRQVIEFRFRQDLSVKEVAALTGKSEGAVKALQHRAVEHLRIIAGNSDTMRDILLAS